MNHVILSASHWYHTGDWNEDAPVWSSKLDEAYQFTSKETALDTMRRHIEADQAAKRVPGFAGCRAGSVVWEVLRVLKKRGYNVKADGADVVATIEPLGSSEAKKKIPIAMAGVKISVVTTLGQVLR